MPQTPSTRWCPTPEQLMILEDMYRSGLRTPTAPQIQQITTHLSYYGKIEGKNVFYWFQNHKARDRQKLRRRLSRQHQFLHHIPHSHPLQFHSLEETPHPPPPAQLHLQTAPHYLHQGCFQEASQGLNLLCKLETGHLEEEEPVTNSTSHDEDWMVMMDAGLALPRCCMTPKTLDLFPTKSTGLKDDCSTSKSTSCSTSSSICML